MIFPHPNKAVRIFYPDALWRVKTNKKEIYLTFDDGPTPSVTEKVLKLLDRFNVKATFFCLASKVENNPNLFGSILKSGHAVGNHSYSHLKGSVTKNQEYYADIDRANGIIKSNLLRPPYGSLRLCQYYLLRKKYRIVFWDVITYDYHPKVDAERCFQITKRYVKPGSIIVFHDNEKAAETMLSALEHTLEYFRKKEYNFEKL